MKKSVLSSKVLIRKIPLLNLPYYRMEIDGDKTHVWIFGLKVFYQNIRGAKITRRMLFFRYSRVDKTKALLLHMQRHFDKELRQVQRFFQDRLDGVQAKMEQAMAESAVQQAASQHDLIKAAVENRKSLALLRQEVYGKLQELKRDRDRVCQSLESMHEKLQTEMTKAEVCLQTSMETLHKETSATIAPFVKILEQHPALATDMREVRFFSREAVWAHVFHDTILGSVWLKDKSFSPGRWAVGYPYLYAMYRVLDEVRPKSILELGLGQSTRMIAQYAEHTGARHVVVEHDPEWIAFFARNFALPPSTEVVKLPWEFVDFEGAKGVRRFQGFVEKFGLDHFDFISIDAPLGGDMHDFARIDFLQIMPGCLDVDFVIMLDDVERSGERHTLALMEKTLKDAGIAYAKGVYWGGKKSAVLASQSLRFVTSM